jgi:hypothetical protein
VISTAAFFAEASTIGFEHFVCTNLIHAATVTSALNSGAPKRERERKKEKESEKNIFKT